MQITDLRVPQVVRNNSGRPIVLDCEYSLTPEEEGSGLVVKWFFDSQPAPVYQWIFSQRPQDLGILRGRLNLDYRASNHAAMAHRALQITNPTTELSGDYKCSVSTFHDEDFMVKRMLIFAPEKRLEIWHSRGPREGLINVTCFAAGAFPEPSLSLHRDISGGGPALEDVRTETRTRLGSYDVTTRVVIQEPEEPAVFHCELRIQDAQYEVRKTLLYYPVTSTRQALIATKRE
ncbi:hypothetical protein B566_EDAN004928 [Ephemera danica]|nr:hypothetical protein B566_EDAN004928 [Ephemera danica]